MSRRSRAKASSADDDENVRLTLLSSNGSRFELNTSLRQSLNDIKRTISETAELGNIPKEHQRIFYLGREMKTGGRSLEALGVGRFGINAIHVHNTKPAAAAAAAAGSQQQAHQQQNVYDLVNDSSDDGSDNNDDKNAESDSDDEVCIVDVTRPAASKRRRRA